MIIGDLKNGLEYSIESYSRDLVKLFQTYMDNTKIMGNSYSNNADIKAKIILNHVIFPNNKEFNKDFNIIKNDIGAKTCNLVSQYTRCIMQLLGRLAEAMIIEKCTNDEEKNIVFMNIALYKKDIYKKYEDINYNDYVPFSPSFKKIFVEINGIIQAYNAPEYNPQHTSKDIGWCKKNNIIEQLKVNLSNFGYMDNAKLQVKVSINYRNVDIKPDYYLTPIIYFDLLNDGICLKNNYPNSHIVLGREVDQNMVVDLEHYFKILAAYITGISDHIDIKDYEVKNNNVLGYLFRSDLNNLFNHNNGKNILDCIREQIDRHKSPIIIGG